MKRHHSSAGHQRSASMSITPVRHNPASEKPPRPRWSVSDQVSNPSLFTAPLSTFTTTPSFNPIHASQSLSYDYHSHSSPQSPDSITSYVRPTGPELVSSKVPSCIGLPPSWNYIHDRFIAYLATHAPLDKNGKVPRHEERRERWETEDIVRLVEERFPRLGRNVSSSLLVCIFVCIF
jgi:hypothetical protein